MQDAIEGVLDRRPSGVSAPQLASLFSSPDTAARLQAALQVSERLHRTHGLLSQCIARSRLLALHCPPAAGLRLQSACGLCRRSSWTKHAAYCSNRTDQHNSSQGLVDDMRVVRRGGPGSMSSTVALDDSAVLFTRL